MSDERPEAIRRARRASSDDALEPDVVDDTPGELDSPSRQGGRFEAGAASNDAIGDAGPQGDQSDDDTGIEGDQVGQDTTETQTPIAAPPVATPAPGGAVPVPGAHAAFMRPGTSSAGTPEPPSPPEPASPPEPPSPPEPVRPGGRFSSGKGDAEGDGPAARRSAATSSTPPEFPSFEAPAAIGSVAWTAAHNPATSQTSPASSTEGASQDGGTTDGGTTDGGTKDGGAKDGSSKDIGDDEDELTTNAARNPWVTRILVGVLVLALVAAAGYFALQQSRKPDVSVTVTQSPSGSATPTGPEAVTDASLLTDAEAAARLGGTNWTITETLSEVLASSAQVTCMTNPEGLPNAQITRQRVLDSGQDNALAALHRIDAYATEALAAQAYQVRLAKLSACDDVPAWLSSSASVAGLADESFSLTIAYQDPTLQYRTVVISRTGTAVSMIDVAQNETAVDPANVAQAAVEPSKRLCQSAGGTCPTDLAVRAEVVPPTPIFGWLAQSDIPRITAGQGLWSATQVGQVTTKGSQCENVTLASVNGPTSREQRSYLLDQDDRAPEAFGVDQVRFVFADAAAAQAFATKLGTDIAACGTRTETATVSEDRTLSISGQNRQPVTGRIFLVTQATGENTNVYFRVAVVVSGNRVTYLVSNTRENFDFTTDSWLLVAARAGQRITQSR